jgi:hypothetical protein
MSWVKDALADLHGGRLAKVRPSGGSMRGRIESGQLVTIAPAAAADLHVDDVVFVHWKGNYLLHLVKAIEPGRFLIGNNIGKVNGWVASDAIIGKVIAVED